MTELKNSRNVPHQFKDHFVKFILFSYLILLHLSAQYYMKGNVFYKPWFCNHEVRMYPFGCNDGGNMTDSEPLIWKKSVNSLKKKYSPFFIRMYSTLF